MEAGRWRSGRPEIKFCSISRLCIVMVDTRVRVARQMVDKDESGAVTTDLTINLYSGSAAIMRLISAIVHQFLPASSNGRIASTHVTSILRFTQPAVRHFFSCSKVS
ncbi:hypothetical protein TNCV_2121881 [Trichonephila clavipes]|nr:hypothetical protein TNCV_2121881 [Trichonephila clavipes]